MFIELTVASLLFAAWKRAGSKKGEFTPERERIYLAAMEHLDAEKLRKLADEFEKQGLITHAAMLRKRADLRSTPESTRIERRAAYEKGMRSDKIDGILRLANAFERLTATGAAASLRAHANEVQKKKALELELAKKADKDQVEKDVGKHPTSNGISNKSEVINVVGEVVKEKSL